MTISKDMSDILFRALFCLIFLGLGGEHIVSDDLIRRLMPAWVPAPRIVSLLCGLWLVFWGTMILVGYRLRLAATAIAAFLLVVTVTVHVPGLFTGPSNIPADWYWMWDILQRSNLVKNLCLLGVCFHLLHHEVGKYSYKMFIKVAQ